jgi:hypothetical protein
MTPKTTATDRARQLIDNLPCWQEGDNNEGVIIEEGEEILIDRIAKELLEARKEGIEEAAKIAEQGDITGFGNIPLMNPREWDKGTEDARDCIARNIRSLNNDSEKVGE